MNNNFQNHSSFREHRLCFDNAIETLAEKGMAEGKKFLADLQTPNMPKTEEQITTELQALGDQKDKKEFWQNALNGLDERVRNSVIQNLKSLEQRTQGKAAKDQLEYMRVMFESLQQQGADAAQKTIEVPKGILEKTSKFLDDANQDFWQGSGMKKTAYVASGIAGFIAARWVWRQLFGNGEKQGIIKRTGKWIASLAGAGAAIVAGKSVMDWWNKKTASPWSLIAALWASMTGEKKSGDTPPPNTPGAGNANPEPVGTLGQAANFGRDLTIGATKEALETGEDLGKVLLTLFEKGNYESAMEMIAAKGLILIWEGGKFVVTDGPGKVICSPLLLAKDFGKWLCGYEDTGDLVMAWGENGVAYFLGKKIYNAGLKGDFSVLKFDRKSLITVPWEILKTPGTMLWDATKVIATLRQQNGAQALYIHYIKHTWPGKLAFWRERTSMLKNIASDTDAMNGVEIWKRTTKEFQVMDAFDADAGFKKLFAEDAVKQGLNIKNAAAENLQNYLKRMKITDETPELLRSLHEIKDMPSIDVFQEEMNKIYTRYMARETKVTREAAKVTQNAMDAATEVKVSSATRATDSAGETPNATVKTGQASEAANAAADTTATPAKGEKVVSDIKTNVPTEPVPATAKTTPVEGKNAAVATAEAARDIESNTRATNTAEVLGETAKTATKAAIVVENTTKPIETMRAFDKFYEEIRAARAGKDNAKLFQLLRNSAELIKAEAAAGNRTAQAMLLVLRLEKAAKIGGKMLLILGPLVDAALLIVNRIDMKNAKQAKNEEMLRTLESKEKVLLGQAGVGLSMFLMTGPQALAVAPFAIASSVMANNIYNSVIQWEKSSRQWMNETPETLKTKYAELTIGYVDSGHSAGIGTSPIMRPFTNWGKTSKEVEQGEFNAIESVNQHVRQEILTAYFLKTMKVPTVPNETQEQYKDRALIGVRDRLSYVKAMTDGSYARAVIPEERFFGQAEDYGNIAALQRTLDADNKQRLLSYEWNGTVEQLDLGTLDYIRNPRTGNGAKDHQRSMAFLKTMQQYREQVSVYGDAVREMQAMAPSIMEEKEQPKVAPKKAA